MQLKLALPKGRLMSPTADRLEKAGLCLEEYGNGSRSYRPICRPVPGLQLKVFHEKDIPIQVAIGNYDLGICGLDWVEELLAKFPASSVVKVKDLGYGFSSLHLAASAHGPVSSIEDLRTFGGVVRLASEYPNLAEALALRLRLRRFQVFPLWGAAESYPPESAEVALIAGNGAVAPGLRSLAPVLPSSAFLIANRKSWESRDMEELLSLIVEDSRNGEGARRDEREGPQSQGPVGQSPSATPYSEPCLRLALPDGHQQLPTLDFLRQAGLNIDGYGVDGNARPNLDLPGVFAKVIRPQDMPMQVACGNFDLAISGQDWLLDHLIRFPTSPVRELFGLGFGKVRVVSVVSEQLRMGTAHDLRGLVEKGFFPRLRVASEYVNIADKYARDNHLGHYQIIPTWGASEAFLPEDADLLIENTQTGRTLAKNKLKIIDTILESQACVISRLDGPREPVAKAAMNSLIDAFRRALNGRR